MQLAKRFSPQFTYLAINNDTTNPLHNEGIKICTNLLGDVVYFRNKNLK